MFTGFSQETFDFLFGLHFHNERTWFEAHKEDYKRYLHQPLTELSREVFARMTDAYPDRDLVSKVARIYKDARVYHGPCPYKEELWFSLRVPCEHWEDAPGFWFGLERDSWTYGMGAYAPRPATMERHRLYLDRDPAPLTKLANALKKQSEFVLEGDAYAKHKPCAHPKLQEWYDLRNYSIYHRGDDVTELFDPALPERIAKGFRFLMPYHDYFRPFCQSAQGSPLL